MTPPSVKRGNTRVIRTDFTNAIRLVRRHDGVRPRRGAGVERAVPIDEDGDPVVRDVTPLVRMRPNWTTVACGFDPAEVTAGLDPLEPIGRCARWSIGDLVADEKAERCGVCQCAAARRGWR
jgi:hypothetical protein